VFKQTDFSISYVRPDSPQLFFLFVGIWNAMTINTVDFLRATAIGDRNIVILKDPHQTHCYYRGVSDRYPSLDGITEWQREQLAGPFAHVREVFCAGTSAGGGAAIHCGYRLRARAAWSFGGRVVKPEVAAERDRVAMDLYRRVIGRPALERLTAEEQARLVEALKDPEMQRLRWDLTGNPDTLVAGERVRDLVDLLGANSVPTHFHFYYATTNAIDREFAQAFQDCPGVTLHPIVPPPTDWSQDVIFRDPDHGIVSMLYEMGRLGTLFSDYL
jgi:hypothetical protein